MKTLPGCSWEALVSRSCKILSSSGWSLYDDLVRLVKVLYDSCKWSVHDLAQVLVKRSIEDLAEILLRRSLQ